MNAPTLVHLTDKILQLVCYRCGVQFTIRTSTIKKRKLRGADEHTYLCQDCKPYTLREGKMTSHEIWDAYAKDMGIK